MTPFPDLHWRVLDVTLANTRNVFARQHPLSILDAVFKYAAGRGGVQSPYFFHPVERALPARISRGGRFQLEVVFPTAQQADVDAFAVGLQEHLVDPSNNFRIQGAPTSWQESLAERVDAFVASGVPEEVCLDFITPVPFKPQDQKRRWLFSAQELCRLLVRRVERFYGKCWAGTDALHEAIVTLPYYWEYARHKHPSRSGRGVQFVDGMTGPLFLKGDIGSVLPLLLAGERLHVGRRLAAGMGAYLVRQEVSYFDALLGEQRFQERVADQLERESDRANELEREYGSVRAAVTQVAEDILDGCYEPAPASAVDVPTTSGAKRRLVTYAAKDVALQQVLQTLLSPALEKMFEEASIWRRCGRSRETGRRMVMQAVGEGFSYALEADIQSFWDEVPHAPLLRVLEREFPMADRQTLGAVQACMECPVSMGGRVVCESTGLAQGNALTPLLANLYLDTLDEQMEERGYRLVRYADRLIVLTRELEGAEAAREALCGILARLGLRLNMEQVTISSCEEGVSFLGRTYGLDVDDELEGEAPLRRTVTVTNRYAFVGVDHDSLCVRKGEADLARVPLARVENIVMMGNNSLSARLVQKCASESIPITFCSAAGHYVGSVQPDSKRHFEMAGRHLGRFEALAPDARVRAARDVVLAKISNYQQWLRARGVDGQSLHAFEQAMRGAAQAQTVGALRGHEGHAAKAAFAVTQALVSPDVTGGSFASRKREARAKADRWNTLLDCLYSQLFARLNVLVRGRGLNPYLGVLHSHKDNYESLVCDLQEPFRFRMDRLALRMVNKREILPEDFDRSKAGRYRLTRGGFAKVVEAFERERRVQMAQDSRALGDLLASQVAAVARWVGGDELELYRSGSTMKTRGACNTL